MSSDEQFRVSVGPEGLYFSAAHFITYGGTECESLHGHNYRVRVELSGPLNEHAYVYDFVELRSETAGLLDDLDHRLLLPEENPRFRVRRGGDQVEVEVGERAFRFPAADVVHLPVRNTTAEELASYLADRLSAVLAESGAREDFGELSVEVEESPGQAAVHRRRLAGG